MFRIFAGMIALAAAPAIAKSAPAESFASAEAASSALYQAVQRQDEHAVAAILDGDKTLVSVGDQLLDKLERQRFIRKYQEMNRLVPQPDGDVVLIIGAENWPFPIPIVTQQGAWHFDADAGRDEVLARRIGQNELAAIETCQALAAAERSDHRNSLADEATDAFVALVASMQSGRASVPFHGYYYRILSVAGARAPEAAEAAPAFIAYPVAYRSTGVMTFTVGADGVVHEKDLGGDTAKLARAMTSHQLDPAWTVSTP